MNKPYDMPVEIEKQESLICEALVREICYADRWSAVCQIWEALLKVRQMAKSLKDERKHWGYSGCLAQHKDEELK